MRLCDARAARQEVRASAPRPAAPSGASAAAPRAACRLRPRRGGAGAKRARSAGAGSAGVLARLGATGEGAFALFQFGPPPFATFARLQGCCWLLRSCESLRSRPRRPQAPWRRRRRRWRMTLRRWSPSWRVSCLPSRRRAQRAAQLCAAMRRTQAPWRTRTHSGCVLGAARPRSARNAAPSAPQRPWWLSAARESWLHGGTPRLSRLAPALADERSSQPHGASADGCAPHLSRLSPALTHARAAWQDTQIAADCITNAAFFDALRRCGEVSCAASEEESVPQTLNPAGAYSVRFPRLRWGVLRRFRRSIVQPGTHFG